MFLKKALEIKLFTLVHKMSCWHRQIMNTNLHISMSHMQVKQEMFVKYYAPLRDKLSAAHGRLNQTGLVQLRSVLGSSKGTWITGPVGVSSREFQGYMDHWSGPVEVSSSEFQGYLDHWSSWVEVSSSEFQGYLDH